MGLVVIMMILCVFIDWSPRGVNLQSNLKIQKCVNEIKTEPVG